MLIGVENTPVLITGSTSLPPLRPQVLLPRCDSVFDELKGATVKGVDSNQHGIPECTMDMRQVVDLGPHSFSENKQLDSRVALSLATEASWPAILQFADDVIRWAAESNSDCERIGIPP